MKNNRQAELKLEIMKAFDHLADDEIEILESNYERSTTRMIEVIDVKMKSAKVMDLNEDIEFTPVLFPTAILSLLVRHDVFYATLGLRHKKWEVIYLSPPYKSQVISNT